MRRVIGTCTLARDRLALHAHIPALPPLELFPAAIAHSRTTTPRRPMTYEELKTEAEPSRRWVKASLLLATLTPAA